MNKIFENLFNFFPTFSKRLEQEDLAIIAIYYNASIERQ